MVAERSPSQEFQQRRKLSINAEDELFKSLQGLQERNNSQRQQRTTMGSPTLNHSHRMKRRSSLDLTGGLMATAASSGSRSRRINRRTSLDLNGGQQTTTASAGNNHNERMKRRNSSDLNRGGSTSSRRERRSIDTSKAAASPGSYRARRQRRNSVSNNNGVAQRNSWHGQRTLQNETPTGVGTKPRPLFLEDRQSSGRTKRKSNRIRRRVSVDSPGVIQKSLNNSVQRNIRNVTPTGTQLNNGGEGIKPQPLCLDDRQSSEGTTRKAYRLGKGRRASTGMGPEINPKITPKRLSARSSSQTNDPETPSTPVTTAGPPLVIRSFSRRLSLSTNSPTSSPTSPAGCNFYPAANQKCAAKRSPRESKEWTETTPKANSRESSKSLISILDNSTTSWASFDDGDDDIIDSDVEKFGSERTNSTKPLSERMSISDRSDINADLYNLLDQLKDPAEVERRKMEREGLTRKTSSKNATTQTAHNDKVAEQSSSRNLKTFLQRSKRGYVQQANLDAPSAMQ